MCKEHEQVIYNKRHTKVQKAYEQVVNVISNKWNTFIFSISKMTVTNNVHPSDYQRLKRAMIPDTNTNIVQVKM